MKGTQRIRAVAAPLRPGRAERRNHAEPRPDAPAPSAPQMTGHRDADPPLDLATYSCSCGYVFEAQVQTRVDCPHCGGQQAW